MKMKFIVLMSGMILFSLVLCFSVIVVDKMVIVYCGVSGYLLEYILLVKVMVYVQGVDYFE